MKTLAKSIHREYRSWRAYRKQHLISIPASQKRVINLISHLTPIALQGMKKIRLGNPFDGGYVMIDDFDNIKAAYSLGIADDVSWDLDIAKRGIPIFQYDHTIEGLPIHHPLFNFNQIGIGAHTDKNKKIETVQKIMDANGHTAQCNLLLKIALKEVNGKRLRVLI